MRARKAVIPAAGLGTRFLPATKAAPKELLPVVDKPAIQYVVEEAAGAGLDDVLFVTAQGKSALEDHFDVSQQLEDELEAKGKADLLAVVRAVSRLARVTAVRQGRPLGLGHAIGCAREHVGDEPFAVLLPDDLLDSSRRHLQRMIDLCEQDGRTVVTVMDAADLGPDALDDYGVIEGEEDPDRPGVYRVAGMVEKPGRANAPSSLCVVARYVLTPDIFDRIAGTRPGRGGEIQITDAMKAQAADEPIRALRYEGARYDVGNKSDWLRAIVELAAAHPQLGPDFRAFLTKFAASLDDAPGGSTGAAASATSA